MFAIAVEQKQYQTYILSDRAAHSHVEVVPERGGIVTRWCIQAREILYLDAERFADPSLSVRGGIPILFPICGNLPDNTYRYKGQTYSLKQHGFARDLPWDVAEQVSQNQVSLTLVLHSSERTRSLYPFDFQLAVTYRLQGNRLEIQQHYTNRSEEPMPCSTGLHPYFWVSDKFQLAFDIPATQVQDQHTKAVQPFSGQFDFETDEIDVGFHPLSRRSATVRDRARSMQLTLQYDKTYTNLVFWTVKGKDYYCLEPWSAPRNALNTGKQLTYIEPGATLETSVSLSVSL